MSDELKKRDTDLRQRLVRPVKCHFCNQPMFYSGDERHEPEVMVSVDTRGGIGEPPEYGFYAHVRCWNAKMAEGGTAIKRIAVPGESTTFMCAVCERESERPYHVDMQICHCCMSVLYDQRPSPNTLKIPCKTGEISDETEYETCKTKSDAD